MLANNIEKTIFNNKMIFEILSSILATGAIECILNFVTLEPLLLLNQNSKNLSQAFDIKIVGQKIKIAIRIILKEEVNIINITKIVNSIIVNHLVINYDFKAQDIKIMLYIEGIKNV